MTADRILLLDEAAARSLVLAQALETADSGRRLVGDEERAALEQAALEASRRPGAELDPGPYLRDRARRLLALAAGRDPRIAALDRPPAWMAWLAVGLPAACCVLAAAADRIGNPDKVNMLSRPLLAVLAWNLLVYLWLALQPLLRRFLRRWQEPAVALHRWLATRGAQAGRAPGRAGHGLLFQWRWHELTAALQAWHWKAVLHACAAGWAVGLALSIALGGIDTDYRIGWESTWLDAQQVHALLGAMFAPVIALLPFEPFTLADIQRMRFDAGMAAPVEHARHWVLLYIALLALVVVLPRAALAAHAAWRRHRLAQAVAIDLREPYYVDALARVSPARLLLVLVDGDAAGAQAVRAVLREAQQLATAKDDRLSWMELGVDQVPPPQAAASPAQAWLKDMFARWKLPGPPHRPTVAETARDQGDAVLLALGAQQELAVAGPLLQALGKPVVVLAGTGATAGTVALLREELAALGLAGEVLPTGQALGNWWREQALRDALGRLLPRAQAAGWERLAQAWEQRHAERFDASMGLLAQEVVQAARDVETVHVAPLSLRRLIHADEREADAQARRVAMALVLKRLQATQERVRTELLRLHGIGELPSAQVPAVKDEFVLQQAIDTPQAGMTGVATGAAMGATLDLLVGGLSLGAGMALGALLGGGAAMAAAAWKNRGTPGGASSVQFSDEMLQTLAEAVVLRYLVVAHQGRIETVPSPMPAWKSGVVAAVEARRERLGALWAQARAEPASADVERAVAGELAEITSRFLR